MKKLIFTILLFISSNSFAGYNANVATKISGVLTYTGGDYIYVQIEASTTTACNNNFFVIHESVPYERKQMLLSRLLMAYASKETINIGYDAEAGDCAHGYVRIHRVG